MSRVIDPAGVAFTCRSCGNARFASSEEQREHYQGEWHTYNLKRKVAGMAPLAFPVFKARLEQMQQQQQTQVEQTQQKGTHKKKAKGGRKGRSDVEASPTDDNDTREASLASNSSRDREKTVEELMEERLKVASPIEPPHCLFCQTKSPSVDRALAHMQKEHNFKMPFTEYLADLEGLYRYIGKKIGVGYACVLCNKSFTSLEAVRKHMIDKAHTRMDFSGDGGEYSDFYDFRASYPDYDPDAASDLEDENADEEEIESEEEASEDEEWESDGEWEQLEGDDVAEMQREGAIEGVAGEIAIQKEDTKERRKKHLSRKSILSASARLTSGGMFVEIYDPETKRMKILGHRSLQRYFKQNFHQPDERAPVLLSLLDRYKKYGFEGGISDLIAMSDKDRERKLMQLSDPKSMVVQNHNFRQVSMQQEMKARTKDKITYQLKGHKLKRTYNLSKRSGQQNVGVHG